MRATLFLVLCLVSTAVSAQNMTAVPDREGYCGRQEEDAICHEWQLAREPRLRFVAFGYEDGVDYSFYELKKGQYRQLVRVYPALQDSARPNQLFWAYPWDITDIALDTLGGQVLATFEHGLEAEDDSVVESPDWQKRVPLVLFRGTTTQPQAVVAGVKFEARRIRSLARRAGR